MKSDTFIEEILIQNIESLLKNEQYYPLFIYTSIGIETLGAIIDNKPIRTRNQSKYRFGIALYQLFPNQYGFVNKNSFLYDTLRNHAIHNLLPSSKLFVVNKDTGNVRHLDQSKDRVTFIIETFAKDFLNASREALKKIRSGEVKIKQIAF